MQLTDDVAAVLGLFTRAINGLTGQAYEAAVDALAERGMTLAHYTRAALSPVEKIAGARVDLVRAASTADSIRHHVDAAIGGVVTAIGKDGVQQLARGIDPQLAFQAFQPRDAGMPNVSVVLATAAKPMIGQAPGTPAPRMRLDLPGRHH